MIYFAQLPTGSIKIGCTGDVGARMGHLAAARQCKTKEEATKARIMPSKPPAGGS